MIRFTRYGLMLLATLFVISCQESDDRPVVSSLPEIKDVPQFAFTNFDGSTVTNRDLEGSVYIAYFFFTSCGGPCPIMNSTANVLQADYADHGDFRIIGFSVDPERDDVARLAKYAERYSARPGTWFMARSGIDTVSALASKGFMMGDANVPAMHSTRFALVDRHGVIRGYYDGLDEKNVRELRAAIDYLLGEKG
jgi:protein SCO1/2